MISVVIPIYNKLPHLERSIQSVLKQSYQDIEVLLIDDSSTDGSSEYIKKFEQLQNVFLFYRTEPGPGGYAARNLGIEKAKGEWVAFLDADDEWFPDHLEKMMKLASAYPEANFLSCGWELSKDGRQNICPFYQSNAGQNVELNLVDFLKSANKGKSPIWTSVVLIKQILPVAKELFPSNLGAKRGGDSYAWLKLFASGEKLYWSNHIGGIYFIDSVNQVTRTAKGEFKLFNKRNFATMANNLNKKEIHYLRKYFNRKIFQNWIISLDSIENKNYLADSVVLGGDYLRLLFITTISRLPLRLLIANKHFIYKLSSKL